MRRSLPYGPTLAALAIWAGVLGGAQAAGAAQLAAVSCPRARSCTAVGSHGTTQATLAESWNGTAWRVRPTPNPAGATASELVAVSCTAPTSCVAVGDSSGAGATSPQTLAEVLSGKAWTITPTPTPPGATSAYLTGVACAGSSSCMAVGYYVAGGVFMTLAEHWDGTSWTIVPSPNAPGSRASILNAVSCSSTSACTAVGFYNARGDKTLAIRWDGTGWTLQPTPGLPYPLHELWGVSCPASELCVGVGVFANAGMLSTLAEGWSSNAWATEATPNPAGATPNWLNSVSCPTSGYCAAAGYSDLTAPAGETLVEARTAGTWSVQASPNPAGAKSSSLNGIACSSASACTSVGTYLDGSGNQTTLAERWNGTTWTIQVIPNPS